MIKEELKKDLIKYISHLTNDIDNLEDMTYEYLYITYLNLIGISVEEMDQEISLHLNDYRKNNPDTYINKEELICELHLLDPINLVPMLDRKIITTKAKILETKSEIELYNNFLQTDTKYLEDEDLNNFQKAELPSDISYDKKVIESSSRLLERLEQDLKIEQVNLNKLLNYNELTR